MRHEVTAITLLALALAGCQTRSISDSGYRSWGDSPELYRGELHELDVLGIFDGEALLGSETPVSLERGQPVLLIQSGAVMPDPDMLAAVGAHFSVGTMSGIPRLPGEITPNLRVAAARGGYESIICYWGVIESTRSGTAGKSLSWVPIAGFYVPDETQRVRMRLKLLVVDVETGRWTQLMPTPSEDLAGSAYVSRAASDQNQVAEVKRAGYATACRELVSALVR